VNQEPKKDSAPVVNVILLGAGFGTGNMGVAALASGTIASALSSFPNAKVWLLDYGKEAKVYDFRQGSTSFQVELINLRFSKRIFLPNNIARLLGTALCLRLLPLATRRAWTRRNRWLNAIDGADIIGAISGGDSFSDIYGFRRLLYVTLPQLLVLILGRPLVLLPQTYGPFKSKLARMIARWVMRRAHSIYSRDVAGVEVVSELIGDSGPPAEFAYDMGFALEPHEPPEAVTALVSRLKNGKSLVGLNVSGLLYVGGYTGNNMFGLKNDYRKLLLLIVEHFVRADCDVLLIPHVFGDGLESDTSASQDFWDNLSPALKSRVHNFQGRLDQHEVKYVIGQCDFFLGSRMHACIAALSQCVPSVPLAYSKKFLGVMRSIEMDAVVADLREEDEAQVIDRLTKAYDSRQRIREELELKMPEVKRRVLGLFSQLVQREKTQSLTKSAVDLVSSRPVL
jgi:colanic acid/amylovoran biosynthesis protein